MLSKEERLELVDKALEENEKVMIEVERLIKVFMDPKFYDEVPWELAIQLTEQRNTKQKTLLYWKQQILNEP